MVQNLLNIDYEPNKSTIIPAVIFNHSNSRSVVGHLRKEISMGKLVQKVARWKKATKSAVRVLQQHCHS